MKESNGINGNESLMEVMSKLSEGNPEAVNALMSLWSETPHIDPDSALGGLGPILQLDSLGIYGTEIYVLFNDQCGRDTRKMIMLLRAVQLGLLPHDRLKTLASDQMRTNIIDEGEWAEIDTQVCAQLGGFKR